MLILFFLLTFNILMQVASPYCNANCDSCNSITQCVACSNQHYLVNGECKPCPPNCLRCAADSNGLPKCILCLTFNGLSNDGGCLQCEPRCNACTNTSTSCNYCRNNFVLQGSQCIQNSSCNSIPLCQTCLKTNYSSQICSQCPYGYFAFRRGCQKCSSTCDSCYYNMVTGIKQIKQFWNTKRSQLLSLISPGSTNQIYNNSIKYPPNSTVYYSQNNQNLQYKLPSTFVEEYKNWTKSDWDAATWTSVPIYQAPFISETNLRGWVQGYLFFKVLENTLPTQTNLTMFMYYCLPIVQELLGMTYLKQQGGEAQWQHLARFVSKFTSKPWNGAVLNSQIAKLAASKASCHSCIGGYFLQNQKCLKCSYDGCASCISQQICYNCMAGYSTDYEWGGCFPCSSSNCINCQFGSGSCYYCQSGYISYMGGCITCAAPCATCFGNGSLCLTCDSTYSLYPYSNGTCYKCNLPYCLLCDQKNTSLCYSCKDGYVLKGDICKACPTGCQTCLVANNSIKCNKCTMGYSINNFTCLKCPDECATCLSSNVSACLSCIDGKYFKISTASCLPCPSACKKCIHAQQCTQQQTGLALYLGSSIRCMTGCLKCSPLNPRQCINCQPRFYLNNSVCYPCISGCNFCYMNECSNCIQSYFRQKSSCLVCPTQCKTCNINNNITVCLSCVYGLTLDAGKCVSNCSTDCILCNFTNPSNCIQYAIGYALSAANKCVKCTGECSGRCNPKNVTQCYSCMKGFQLLDYSCTKCPQGCSTCENKKCSQCVEGYKLNTTSSLCVVQCLFPCLACQNRSCTLCESGYALQNGTCIVNVSCNPICLTCLPGSQLNSSSYECVQCPKDCSTCNKGVCTVCFEGYYLSSGACVQCASPCNSCYDKQNCRTCASGYTKQVVSVSELSVTFGNRCVACNQSCLTCQIYTYKCTSCKTGYRLQGYRCIGVYLVEYQTQLDFSYSAFVQNNEVYTFSSALIKKLGCTADKHIVKHIKTGSTIIEGIVSASNQTEANQFLAKFNKNTALGNYKLLSSSAQVTQNGQPVSNGTTTTTTTTTTSNNWTVDNKGVIIGSVIGGVALVIILVIVNETVFLKRKNNKIIAEEKKITTVQYQGQKIPIESAKYIQTTANTIPLQSAQTIPIEGHVL